MDARYKYVDARMGGLPLGLGASGLTFVSSSMDPTLVGTRWALRTGLIMTGEGGS